MFALKLVLPIEGRHMRLKLFISIALIIATCVVYWQVGSHEFLVYDDDVYVARNAHVINGLSVDNFFWAFTSIENCNWHPVTWLSHMIDAQLFGMEPRGHHLMNVVYHGIATLLLFMLLVRITENLWQSSFVAALFALHPLHVESVAWVAERKDVLSACFWFLTLLFYTRYAEARRNCAPSYKSAYLYTLCCFILGLMTKPMLVTLPVVMLLLDLWPLQRFRNKLLATGKLPTPQSAESSRSLFMEKIPFFTAVVASSAITFYAQHEGGAVVVLERIPLLLRLQNALVSYLTYVSKIFWPQDLAVFYPFAGSIPLWQVLGSVAILILVTAAALWVRKRSPFVLVGWFWYMVTLLPVIGIIQVGSQSMADRYTYIPSVGLFIIFVWGVPSLLGQNIPAGKKIFLTVSAGLILLVTATLSWYQAAYWKNSITLFKHTLAVTSGNYVIHHNLGIVYGRAGNLTAAIRELRAAVSISPNDNNVRNLLASTLAENGDIDEGIAEFAQALSINPTDQQAASALEYWRKQKDQKTSSSQGITESLPGGK